MAMKFLMPSGFTQAIEYITEGTRRCLGQRKPQTYRMAAAELTDAKYYFVMKRLGGAK